MTLMPQGLTHPATIFGPENILNILRLLHKQTRLEDDKRRDWRAKG